MSESPSKRISLQWTLFVAASMASAIVEWPKAKDLYVYLRAAMSLASGEPIYGPVAVPNMASAQYYYSPFFAWLLEPLATLPWHWVATGWTVLHVAIFWSLWRQLRAWSPRLGASRWLALAWVLASLRVALYDLEMGQVNLALVAMAVLAMHRILGGRAVSGGALLGLGLAIKPLAALLVPYLVWRRRWRASAAVVGVFLALSLLPAVTLGLRSSLALGAKWLHIMIGEGARLEGSGNIGIPSLMAAALLPLVSLRAYWRLLSAVRVALLLAVGHAVTRPLERGDPRARLLRDTSALLLVMTLVSPHQQKYALVTLIPAYAYALAVWSKQARLRPLQWALWLGSFALVSLTTDGLIGAAWSAALTPYRPMTWGALATLLALLAPAAAPRLASGCRTWHNERDFSQQTG